jgi:hypothetical protein
MLSINQCNFAYAVSDDLPFYQISVMAHRMEATAEPRGKKKAILLF